MAATQSSEERKSGSGKEDLSTDINALRSDFQKLSETLSKLTGEQIGRVQEKASNTANEAEDTIRRNPISALAIAIGLGFLVGVMTRR
jgi:ElaB/YqjD/DUF883 family membrane-anchored ribosome-binding protein